MRPYLVYLHPTSYSAYGRRRLVNIARLLLSGARPQRLRLRRDGRLHELACAHAQTSVFLPYADI